MSEGKGQREIQYWNLPGSVDNWAVGVERRVWGMKPKFANIWNRLSPGDVLFSYVVSPVSGVIGHGHVVAKFKGDTPLWPDEISASRVIYPYRFEFEVEGVLGPERWTRDRVPVGNLKVIVRSIGGVPPDVASEILRRLKTKRREPAPAPEPITPEPHRSRHEQAKKLLLDIGRLRRFVCEDEYPIDSGRLDAVWKRVEKGVPTCAFEVQIGGDIYHALGKLKHAFDLWNSKIFLVIDQSSLPKVSELLAGTFHEIADQLKVVQLEDLERLQQVLGIVHRLEKELGLG